jgi:photosystem II stability/assembly factor-like uncharacterized protein
VTRRALFLAGSLVLAGPPIAAQAPARQAGVDPSAIQELRYRVVGPFRAGRTVGAVGIPSQPGTYFIGVNDGGVWKTSDYGRTWRPLFDAAPTGSIGDVAVSPSQPEIIYVGTGEGLHRPDLSVGDGIFKSTDGGQTWSHAGLGDVQQVSRLVVHPTDPRTVFVAAMGHPYGPSEQRGVFRTSDGGTTWDKVLYVDRNTGASQVELDPSNPQTVYAALWEHREAPWENGSFSGTHGGLFKSSDGGTTWRRLARGLPGAEQGLAQVIVAVAPSAASRLYALVAARDGRGVYRSDDAGESWSRVSGDGRLGVDLRVHPKNPDVVFAAGTASYRSDDAGRTWTSIKGAPGGDDYQRIWINPDRPDFMIFTADQGATITTNGGRTWSSWYNQPTAQLYHVATDNQFPYWIYGGQQESGAIGIASRGNGGQITFRDWQGVGADEYAYVAPDPLDPDIVYGGRVQRFNKRTGQSQNVAPEALRSGRYRILRTMPLLFHPADPKTLLFATSVLWKTTTGGERWEIISPDLSREHPEVPDSVGDYRTPEMKTVPRRGVIYAVGPSPLDAGLIWAGTDDGLVHVTRDGGRTWANVTPPELRAWDKVSQVDAGHFDRGTAYIAVNAIRRDDTRPHIFRTHDGGSSWQPIVRGLPANGPVNVVREDPKQRGLLFAGTQREVFFSIDDGDHWQSLRLNMPASSVRDLVVHDDDLVVGTHGRSIWILDGFSLLRDLARGVSTERPQLFTPGAATRVRWNMFSDTPLPPEEPAGQNPPDGAMVDYLLPTSAGEVAIEFVDSRGEVIRRYSSRDEAERLDPATLPYPTYWFRPPQRVATTPGHHRLVWDLRYAPPRGGRRAYSIAAVYRNTPSGPVGPFVQPGRYTVRLTVDGSVVERPIDVRLDPRVKIDPADLQAQTDLSMACYRGADDARELGAAIDRVLAAPGHDQTRRAALAALRGSGLAGDPDILYDSITAVPASEETTVGLQEKFLYMLNLLQAADARPTTQARAAVEALEQSLHALQSRLAQLAGAGHGGGTP